MESKAMMFPGKFDDIEITKTRLNLEKRNAVIPKSRRLICKGRTTTWQ